METIYLHYKHIYPNNVRIYVHTDTPLVLEWHTQVLGLYPKKYVYTRMVFVYTNYGNWKDWRKHCHAIF